MSKHKKVLMERKSYLQNLRNEKGKNLLIAPNGKLRVNCVKGKIQYYHTAEKNDSNGKYISMKEAKLAQALAQKDYDRKIMLTADKEIIAIDNYLTKCPDLLVEDVYDSLHDGRKQLVKPIIELEETYVKKWSEVIYKKKGFYENTPEYYTSKGERVRSKTEVIIANLLYEQGIPYRYEYPVFFEDKGLFYPDFMILNVKERKEWYWEHLGRMDDSAYVEKVMQKIEIYEQNGIIVGENLILTWESKNFPLNPKVIQRKINHYLL